MTSTATGIEVALHGEALMPFLNAAFHGSGTIEVLGGDLDRHRIEVTGIEVRCRETRVTMAAMEAVRSFCSQSKGTWPAAAFGVRLFNGSCRRPAPDRGSTPRPQRPLPCRGFGRNPTIRSCGGSDRHR